LSSVTVAASTCLRAGLYSTIAMLKGEDGAQWLEEVAAPHVHVDAASRVGGSLLSPSGDFRSAA
jgi:thiamine biosynthesis lipoprotein